MGGDCVSAFHPVGVRSSQSRVGRPWRVLPHASEGGRVQGVWKKKQALEGSFIVHRLIKHVRVPGTAVKT